MHSPKKITYIAYGIVAVAIGTMFGVGFVSASKVAYEKIGSPGEAFFARADRKLSFPSLNIPNLLAGSITYKNQNTIQEPPVVLASSITLPDRKDTELIRIGWVGDIVPSDIASASEFENPVPSLFSNVQSLLEDPDLMIGNLEGAITPSLEKVKCKETSTDCFSFRGNAEFASMLSMSGIDLLNMANNHAYDYGKVGFDDTKTILTENSLLETGSPDEITQFQTENGMVAVVGFSPNTGSASLFDKVKMKSMIDEANKKADLVVVVMHAGGEGMDYLHVRDGIETYLGENRGDTKMIAHQAIDFGADIVLGSGPHVLRGIEFYNGKMIAYSLGNFVGAKSLTTKGFLGISGILSVDLAKDGTFGGASLVPISLDEKGAPYIDETKTAFSLINKLSSEDFGIAGAIIQDDGTIVQQ